MSKKKEVLMPKKLLIKDQVYEILETTDLFSADKDSRLASEHLDHWENVILINSTVLPKDGVHITYLGNIIKYLDEDNLFNFEELQKLTKAMYMFFYENPDLVPFIKGEKNLDYLKHGGFVYSVHKMAAPSYLDVENNFIIIDEKGKLPYDVFVLSHCMFQIAQTFINIKNRTGKMIEMIGAFRDVLLANDGLIEYLCSEEHPGDKDLQLIQMGHRQIRLSEQEHLVEKTLDENNEIKFAEHGGQYRDKDRKIYLEANMSGQTKMAIMLHEVLHGVGKMMNINYDKNKMSDSVRDTEEKFVTEMSKGLASVFLSNPHLFKQFHEWCGEDYFKTDEQLEKAKADKKTKVAKLEGLKKQGGKQGE